MSTVHNHILSENALPGMLSKSYFGEFSVGDSLAPYQQLPTPMLTFDTDVVAHNVETMAQWAAEAGVLLAPHGKTTMTPALWKAQLAAGALGITVANFPQARVAVDVGVPMVVIANEFISPPGLRWLKQTLAERSTEFVCWVDSVEAVERMQRELDGAARQVMVCIEVGAQRGRAGAREEQTIAEIVAAVRESPSLALSGFSGFEGAVPEHSAENLAPVREFLDRIGQSFVRHHADMEVEAPLLTAGGSAYFDLVVEHFKPIADQHAGTRVVLRSGAYLLHDELHYGVNTPHESRSSGPELRPAATLWARVISIPEPGLALVDAGKRDLAYDITLPKPRRLHAGDGSVRELLAARLVNTNDQHGYLATESDRVSLGDLIEFDQAHPCTMTDKWREVPLVTPLSEGLLRLDGMVSTYF